ncbi:NACHT domain-containing protein [Nonomuraea sp. NPDC049400]|uniref:NACHT domain-containing protein n=1 Tax=Nonomuraea sp. NPDC049400 TaxID=3364352 RepID=UPI00378DFA74
MIGFVTTLLFTGFLYWIFLATSYQRVTGVYLRRAGTHPRALVQTVGSIIGDIVGREALCGVLIRNLRLGTREVRRPQILVGDVGAGKTAVLVKIVELLTQRGICPVVLRLRDVTLPVDFQGMARKRFQELIDNDLRSNAEADRVWRQLRADDRIVVIGDGLEEALADRVDATHDSDSSVDRDTLLRLGIRRAVDEDLPLLIASRPHDPLRGMEATITELEPLGKGPALDYLRTNGGQPGGHRNPDRHMQRLNHLVQYAGVVETPLYLQIIQRLNRVNRLGRAFPENLLSGTRNGTRPVPESIDRAYLRWRLLKGWEDALVQGYDHEDYALSKPCREATIEVLSALACIGLKQNLLEVRFEDLVGKTRWQPFDSGHSKAPQRDNRPHDRLWAALTQRLEKLSDSLEGISYAKLHENLSLAAMWGSELGVVEAHADRVRFRHSLIEAYLGSRYMGVVLEDPEYQREAFYDPGAEFLMALVFHSRAESATEETAAVSGPPAAVTARMPASVTDPSVPSAPSMSMTMPASIPDQGNPGERFAHEAVNLLTKTANNDNVPRPAKILDMYSAALEIDSSTDAPDPAAIMDQSAATWRRINTDNEPPDNTLHEAKLRFIKSARTVIRIAISRQRSRGGGSTRAQQAYKQLYKFVREEREYAVRLAAAHAIGSGGREAFNVLSGTFREVLDDLGSGSPKADDQALRDRVICAWLAPMLYRSSRLAGDSSRDGTRDVKDSPNENLDTWIRVIADTDPDKRPLFSLEIALAQGFKHAANQRGQYWAPHEQDPLIEKVECALKLSRFWFTHLTLIQALTLCSLPGDPEASLAAHGHGSDPTEQVRYWTKIAGSAYRDPRQTVSSKTHPFVAEAAELCVLALSAVRPAEYCWIDENGVTGQVGSYSRSGVSQYGQNLWIMDSVGWSSLHPRARRLVGDIEVMLNLATRGRYQPEIEQRLARAHRLDLPPCITKDRSPLKLELTIGAAETGHPGSTCADGCPFRLCPYPPQGTILRRAEQNEGFCKELADRSTEAAPWQEELHPRERRRFWEDMAKRVRPKSPDGGNGLPGDTPSS